MRSESTNGIRHPQAANATDPRDSRVTTITASEGTDLGVARDEPDEGRRQTHTAQRNQERVLATHQVADTAEQECAKWADQEPGREGADVLDESGPGGACREKLRSEERGEAAEDVEIVPFDHVPDCCGDDDPAKVLHGELGRSHNSLGSAGGGLRVRSKWHLVKYGRPHRRPPGPWRATSR